MMMMMEDDGGTNNVDTEERQVLYLAAELPGGYPIYVPLIDSLGLEHSVTTYCRVTMPHVGSVCSRHILKFVKDHHVTAKNKSELLYRRYSA